jgi:hypothetical protein
MLRMGPNALGAIEGWPQTSDAIILSAPEYSDYD